MIALALVSVFSFSAFLTLSAFAPELASGRDGRAHALSRSAVGFAGAVRLARASGWQTEIGRVHLDQVRLHSLVVITPERPLDQDELADAMGLSTLIVLPKWQVMPSAERRDWVARMGAYDAALLGAVLEDIAPGAVVARAEGARAPRLAFAGGASFAAGPIEQLQTISGEGLTPIVVDEAQRMVMARVGEEDIYILADPDFLNTRGLANLDTARAGMTMLGLVRVADEPIIFDVTMNGLGAARSALRLAFEPPFLGGTLALVVVAALLGWRAIARSGPDAPRRRAIALGKAALADNSAALIRLAGRTRRISPGYARLVGAEVAESAGGGRRGEDDLAAWLDRLGAARGVTPPFSHLEAEVKAARTQKQMIDAARRLHAWRLEMKRATR
jgi:hypothetical protein